MNNEREYLIQTLAHQILGMRNPDGTTPKASPGIQNVADVSVTIEIDSLVQGQCRRLWIDGAAWTQKVVDEIQRQAKEIDLDNVVKAKVRDALTRVEAAIEREIQKRIEEEVAQRLKNFPQHMAKKLVGKLYDEAWKAAMERGE